MAIDITPMGEELEADFYRTLRLMMVEDGFPRTHIGDILIMDEFEEILKFYAYCTRMTGAVEVFAGRAFRTIKGLRKDGTVAPGHEDDVEMRRRLM